MAGWKRVSHRIAQIYEKCREYGISYTIKKMRARACEKRLDAKLAQCDVPLQEKVVSFVEEGSPEGKACFGAAVHLHLFYEDLLEEFTEYLQRIDFAFDIYVSCQERADRDRIAEYLKKHLPRAEQIDVRGVQNRGRDIAPFYVVFADALREYDYILHIHSKKSLFFGTEQSEWRRQAMGALLPQKRPVSDVLGLMERERIGLYFADTPQQLPRYSNTWLGNGVQGRQLLDALDITADREVFNYPVGSFFWLKAAAIRKLWDAGFSYDDFEAEAGQTDGTLAHVLERAVSFVVRDAGFHLGIYSVQEDIIRLDSSDLLLKGYFAETRETMFERMRNYDVISFGIDTLLGERKDEFLWIWQQLRGRGKKLNIVEDTDMGQEKIRRLLEENGYTGVCECYLSGEIAGNKQDGSLWDVYDKKYHRKLCIHVGSDSNGDIHQPAMRMIEPFFTLSARRQDEDGADYGKV